MAQGKRSNPGNGKKSEALSGQVLPPESPDAGLVMTDGGTIVTFLGNVVQFFRQATEIEADAKATYELAKKTLEPTSLESDQKLQDQIRSVNKKRKTLADFWEITTLFHQVHRRLTTARSRADEPLELAGKLLQQHHNSYAEKARRAAAAEQDRIRQENELAARAEQEREAAALEAKALAAEAASPELSERETVFVDYIANQNMAPGRAASAARYKDPEATAARLVTMPKIQAAIQSRRDAIEIRRQATAVKEAPVEVYVPEVKAQISRIGGFDRTTWSAELLDEDAFIAAVIEGKHGIPRDVLTVRLPKLNQYAKDMEILIDRWPGVRGKKNTKTI